MQIILNGAACQCDGEQTIAALLQRQNLANQRIAVEVNLELVPRSQFNAHYLHDGDRVEIVRAIGGG